MASKNQNKPPSTPSSKYIIDEVSVDKRRRIGSAKMAPNTGTRPQTRQAFSVISGGQDPPPQTNSGPDCCGAVEFTKEDVEALLNEKLKIKNKFNYKEKSEQMGDYIKRLKQGIKWFQPRELNYVEELENLTKKLELAEKEKNDLELQRQAKEDELNSAVMELRTNLEALHEKFAKEEADKLETIDLLGREKEARLAAERLQASLSEELQRLQQELATAKQNIQSLDNKLKGLLEYNSSLQQYNTKLQAQVDAKDETLKRVEKEHSALDVYLSTVKGEYASLQDQLSLSRVSHDEAVKQKEALGSEAASLTTDLQQVREDRDRRLLQVQALTSDVLKHKECTGKIDAELESMSTKTDCLEKTCLAQSEQISRLKEQLALAENEVQLFEEQKALIHDLKNRLADAENKILEGECLTKKLDDTILELKGNPQYVRRIR